jgi:predicted RNA polymerase sigma factor
MFFHVLFMFPETAGKTLEEVELIFTDPNGIPRIGTPAWKTHVDRTRTLDVERRGSLATEGSEETKVAGENGEERIERASDEVRKY